MIGLSGGADSAAMAGLAVRSGAPVRALHVDHGLPASPSLCRSANQAAAALGIDLDVRRVDLRQGANLEARARSARYHQYVVGLRPSEWMLTGHTLDDVAETVLMNMARGSGLDGLSSIARSRAPYHRPLLRLRRAETRELASLMGLPWLDDPANEVSEILRNRVRSTLIPALAEVFGRDPSPSLAQSSFIAQEEREVLERLVDDTPVRLVGGSPAVSIDDLELLETILARRLVRRMWRMMGFEHTLGTAAVDRALEVARGGGKSAQLGGGVVAAVSSGSLMLSMESGRVDYVDVLAEGEVALGSFRFTTLPLAGTFPISPWAAVLPLDKPARIRWAAPGDRLGGETVDGLLGNAALERSPGEGWPVMESEGRVVWVVGVGRLGWEEPDQTRYLSVVAVEEIPWQQSIR